jgi:hypothetical protein
MATKNGSERRTWSAWPPLILLAGASLGSSLLFRALPSEGLDSALRLLSLLPLQMAVLLWVLPRMR